jgi:general secretion pathway protein F
MPTFRYRAYGVRGDLAEGSIDAASQDAASEALWDQGLVPFRLRSAQESHEPWWRRDLSGGARPKAADLAAFTREFSTLAAADIPLDDALRIVSEQQAAPRMRAIVKDLLAHVLNGATLSDAMQKHPVFPADYLSVVRAGEVGGTLGQVLEELADLLERRMEIRARIQSSLIYPAVLVGLSLVSLAAIIGGLLPSITPIFAENGKPVPPGIKMLVALQAHWVEITVLLIGLAFVLAVSAVTALRRPPVRLAFDRFKLRLPVLGPLILQQETARFGRTLGTLLKAGVPLIQAATSAQGVIGNRHIAAGLERTIEAIREGAALHLALAREAVLPSLALRMISVGEEVGKLDQMLKRVAVTFEQQTQRSIERFMTMLTPALTVAIAGLVGGLIMTVVNAILSINELAFQ